LLALHSADALASTGTARQVEFCRHYLKTQPAGAINPPPLVTGDDLVARGFKPGARFATMLEKVRDAQLDGQIRNKSEALDWIDHHFETSKSCRDDDPGLE
jgi:poly(A) polymerase